MSAPRRFDHDQIMRLYAEGKTGPDVAEALGCSVVLVYLTVRRAGIKREFPIIHGTENAYLKRGCRCGPCTYAASSNRDDRRKRQRVFSNHGTHATYSNGCRCPSCRSAHTEYSRTRRAVRR